MLFSINLSIIFLNHSPRHQATFILGNDDLVGSRSPYSVGVALLSSPRNDFHIWIESSRGDCDVQIIRVVINHNTDSQRALNSGGLQDIVTLGISLNDDDPVFQKLSIQAFVGFNERRES